MSKTRSEVIAQAANLSIGCSVAFIDPNTAVGLVAPALTGLAKLGLDFRSKCQTTACEQAIEAALQAEELVGASPDALKEAHLILSLHDAIAEIDMSALVNFSKQNKLEPQFTQLVFDALPTSGRMPEAVNIVHAALSAGIESCFSNAEFRDKLAVEIIISAAADLNRLFGFVRQMAVRQDELVIQLKALIEKQDRTEQDSQTIKLLQEQIAELKARAANPEAALEEAQATIAKLEEALEREGNEIGETRMAEAKDALEAGDFSLADGIFAEIEARGDLAVKQTARAAFARGEIAEQEIRWADAVAQFEKAAGMNPTFASCEKAGKLNWQAGKYDRALFYVSQMKDFAEDEVQLSFALNSEAILLMEQGKYTAAEPLYLQAMEITKATLGEAHSEYATRLNNLAELYRAQAKDAEAEPLYLQAIEVTRETLGEAHPYYANRLNNLALLYVAQGKYAQSEPLFLQAIEIDKATLGEAHPDYATRLNNLAGLYHAQGKYAKAEPFFMQAIEIGKTTLGEAHPEYAKWLNNLAGTYQAQGKYAEAEPLMRQALEILKSALGKSHPSYGTNVWCLAGLHRAIGKADKADARYKDAIQILEKALGENHPRVAEIKSQYENFLKTRDAAD